ncbi:MAG TPA: DUF2934 domain-containing protein [Candidatus Competibacter sp.]|nr:DUF2934 domain-containing protein [Candidatus Competibacter sp.]HRW64756.1 DUF2934 domain-containing protein [Candidatus Competibacter sp.]
MAEKVIGIDELFDNAALTCPSSENDVKSTRLHRLLRAIVMRASTVERIFKNNSDFSKYVYQRHDTQIIQLRMMAEMRRQASVVSRLAASTDDDPELQALSDTIAALPVASACYDDLHQRAYEIFDSRGREHGYALDDWLAAEREMVECRERMSESLAGHYRTLLQRGFVDPSHIFDEVPEIPPLSSFKLISDALKSGDLTISAPQRQQFDQQWAQAIQLFSARWERLTRRPFDRSMPWIDDLVRRKAPVPIQPCWDIKLMSREACALNAEPSATALENSTQHNVAACGDCRASDLLARAGVPPLSTPTEKQPRYTFPVTLLQREDIFYDYGLIVPVEEVGSLGDRITGTEERAITAVQAIAKEAQAVIDFLKGLQLESALGLDLEDLGQAIKGLETVDKATPLFEIQQSKNRFTEWATIVRDAARRRLLLSRIPATDDPKKYIDELSAAINDIPKTRFYKDDQFSYDKVDNGPQRDYLQIYDPDWPGDPANNRRAEPKWLWPGPITKFQGNMAIEENQQRRELSFYLYFIADKLKNRLDTLVSAASKMRDAVTGFQGNVETIREDFEKLATGILNETAWVLARLLDDIASQLPLWSQERSEGSMRLGLLVVFRQCWTPDGYVKGKLVGHKNLIPDQREKIRRRTFVKTVSEQVSTQEFARTRQQDFSRNQKETSEVINESANKFNMTIGAKGGFDIGIGSLDIDTTTEYGFNNMSRSTRSSIAEASMKSAMSYNEKREVKIREEIETQEEFESVTELHNPNQEITANYFYYQLLRQYVVTVALHDVRPVLLRTRQVPSESAIGDKFLADHAHILLNVLPAQLSTDLQDTVNEIEVLARNVLHARTRFNQDQSAYQEVLRSTRPVDPDQARERDERLSRLQETARNAQESFIAADEAYSKNRVRLDRVIEHVRKNRCHYMQFIWQASPTTDYDRILHTETFGGHPLPLLTRGLQRQGYFGNEEIFDFAGPSWGLADALLKMLTPGSDLAALPEEQLRQTELFQLLCRYYSAEEIDNLIEQIGNQNFIMDPAIRNSVLSSRTVQIAQDALVVETMPGQIPLLEGFKAAHRMLDVERACLENMHLKARIEDRPWKERGEDSYRIIRGGTDITASVTNDNNGGNP